MERIVKDKELMWFHESYGLMKLYRIHKVDELNFVAEDLHKGVYTSDEDWDKYCENPELVLDFNKKGD